MKINQSSNWKAIQFMGSPFQGKKWEEQKRQLRQLRQRKVMSNASQDMTESKDENIETLSLAEVEEISSRSIKACDKWYRMCAGISSKLEKYEDGIMYLRIENTETKFYSNGDTAVKFAREWMRWNEELKNTTGFVVTFYKVESTGFIMDGLTAIENKNIVWDIMQKFILESKKEKEPMCVFSGFL